MIPIRDNVPSRRRPVVTVAIIATCAAAFLFENLLDERGLEALFRLCGLVPARYADPRWAAGAGYPKSYWPILAHMFLHGGWMHFIGNMWFLWLFGDNVEDRLGRLRFAAFYLVCGLAAAGAQVAVDPGSRLPVIGASGAISGVMGAYFLLYPGARILTIVPIIVLVQVIEIPAFVFIGLWFVLQLQSGALALGGAAGRTGGIAFWAHVGGFVAGLILLHLFLPRARLRRGKT